MALEFFSMLLFEPIDLRPFGIYVKVSHFPENIKSKRSGMRRKITNRTLLHDQ